MGLQPSTPATASIVGVAGVMVSIVAFQAVDPGSIPGPRIIVLTKDSGSVLYMNENDHERD